GAVSSNRMRWSPAPTPPWVSRVTGPLLAMVGVAAPPAATMPPLPALRWTAPPPAARAVPAVLSRTMAPGPATAWRATTPAPGVVAGPAGACSAVRTPPAAVLNLHFSPAVQAVAPCTLAPARGGCQNSTARSSLPGRPPAVGPLHHGDGK